MGSWPVRVEIRDSSKQSSTQRQQYELPNYTDDYSTAMLYELIGIVRASLRLPSPSYPPPPALTRTPGPPGQPRRSQRVRPSSSLPSHLSPPPIQSSARRHSQRPLALLNLLLKLTTSSPSRIAKTTGTQILSAGGVVRGITNWGIFRLPKPARKHKTLHHNGHYFIVRFDSSSRTQHAVRRTLGLDPRMIRYSVVKMGGTLEEIKKIGGLAEWPGKVE